MSRKTFNFTKDSINTIPLPDKGKRSYYRDSKEKGLVLDVRSSGTKSFYLYKKVGGRPERILIGPYPDMTISQARKETAIKKGEIACGKNPAKEKRKIQNEQTFKYLFDQYMERHSKPYKRSWRYDEREVKRFLSFWYSRKISSITKDEVARLHAKIGKENGLYQANHILIRIRGIFNKAIEWGWDGRNPTQGIKKFRVSSRDRFMQPDELSRFIKSLEGEENETAKDYFWLLLLTGARKTNTLMMRWEQISWDRNEWRIPDTKNGDPLTLPSPFPWWIKPSKSLKRESFTQTVHGFFRVIVQKVITKTLKRHGHAF